MMGLPEGAMQKPSQLLSQLDFARLSSQVHECRYLSVQLTKLLLHYMRAEDSVGVAAVLEYVDARRIHLNAKTAAAALLARGRHLSHENSQHLLARLSASDRNHLWRLFSSPEGGSTASATPSSPGSAKGMSHATALQICSAIINSGPIEPPRLLPAGAAALQKDDASVVDLMQKHDHFYALQQLIGLGLRVRLLIKSLL